MTAFQSTGRRDLKPNSQPREPEVQDAVCPLCGDLIIKDPNHLEDCPEFRGQGVSRRGERRAEVTIKLEDPILAILDTIVVRDGHGSRKLAMMAALWNYASELESLPALDREIELGPHPREIAEIIAENKIMLATELYEEYEARVEDPRTKRTVRKYIRELEKQQLIETEGRASARKYIWMGKQRDGANRI